MLARVLTPALLALAFGVGATAAQEQDRPRETREPVADTIGQDTLHQDTLYATRPALGYQPPALSVSLMVGLTAGADAQDHPVRFLRTDLNGAVLDSAGLNRTVELSGSVYAGVSGAFGLGRDWALRLGLGVMTGTLEASYAGEDEVFVYSANAAASNAADLEILTVESALQYRIPSSRRVQPYLELGAAMSRWNAEGSLPEAAALQSGATRVEVLAGLGASIPVTRTLSARLHVSRHLFRTPVPLPAAGDTLLASSALVVVSRPASATRFADGAREALDRFRLQAGVSYDVGRPPTPDASAEPPPEAAPDTTSQPPR